MGIAVTFIINNDIPRFENAFIVQSNLMTIIMQALISTKATVERLETFEKQTIHISDNTMIAIKSWRKATELKAVDHDILMIRTEDKTTKLQDSLNQ